MPFDMKTFEYVDEERRLIIEEAQELLKFVEEAGSEYSLYETAPEPNIDERLLNLAQMILRQYYWGDREEIGPFSRFLCETYHEDFLVHIYKSDLKEILDLAAHLGDLTTEQDHIFSHLAKIYGLTDIYPLAEESE